MSWVRHPNTGKYKRVTNLGWLLRNWEDVTDFEVIPSSCVYYRDKDNKLVELPDRQMGRYAACWMIAHLRDGRDYVTEWADYTVLADWLVRPKFMTLPVKWFGVNIRIPERKRGW